MISIIDTYSQINILFENKEFDFDRWKGYIEAIYEKSAPVFQQDLKECLDAGNYDFQKDILPIIQAVYKHPKLEILHDSFCKVTENLNEKVIQCFGRELDIDIALYVGLCNGAGWVTYINGRNVILLGIEKILELNWYDQDSMRGLIYHELGHAYHAQHGRFHQQSLQSDQNFVWQLFTEGIAMYFEQRLVHDLDYYHQDKQGWLKWCDDHFFQITTDFASDLPVMTKSNQRYFGDWVSYHGKGDVGYYLGAKFVRHLSDKHDFDQLINLDLKIVWREYLAFVKTN